MTETGGIMRTYFGHAASKGKTTSVFARDDRGPKVLAHHEAYNSEGFTWGHDGAGPTELARCLLLDAFGITECSTSPGPCECISPWVDPVYKAYREAVIANLSDDQDWKLSQLDITDWAFDYLAIKGEPEVEKEPVAVS